MTDLFAVISVSDHAAARPWYERLFGAEPAFVAHETESVWEIAEHAYIAVNEDPGRAGRGTITITPENPEDTIGAISSRGIEPADRETYSNGVTKVIYRDADGNELGYAGPPD